MCKPVQVVSTQDCELAFCVAFLHNLVEGFSVHVEGQEQSKEDFGDCAEGGNGFKKGMGIRGDMAGYTAIALQDVMYANIRGLGGGILQVNKGCSLCICQLL